MEKLPETTPEKQAVHNIWKKMGIDIVNRTVIPLPEVTYIPKDTDEIKKQDALNYQAYLRGEYPDPRN